MYYVMIALGLSFAYINGMHDGGTIVATTISSRLTPARKAVFIAGIANFLGALFLGTEVAQTISENIVSFPLTQSHSAACCYIFVISAFAGSMVWNIFTWVVKLPSSASHSMIGSMIGGGIAAYGLVSIQWMAVFVKVILAMLISPLIGFAAGFLFLKIMNSLLKNATIACNKWIILFHKLSSFFLAFSYGSNDSQKVMGLVVIGLAAKAGSGPSVPLWLMVSASLALALGTITGGYNMIKTVGMDICKIDIHNSFASQVATIFVVTLANLTGLPTSATQVITSSVMGVGTGKTPKSVNWGITKKILLAWVITIPASALIGYIIFQLIWLLH
jgi:PiT family inorganic phosphate transporter